MKVKYHYEYRIAYISDGSVDELIDPTDEAAADDWIRLVNKGQVEGIQPGDAFLQRRRVMTSHGSWVSLLDA